ncbi:methyl-accepting chemotaxis protein [Agrobacterium larrymoorei]|uniref:Methyl-accepting chemotaxis protein n=1 Tax=Agrobacterium larrymoorei TaxID=160699 RepID=A0AAF0KFE6_9HYPH|nr:methyl-accepting chemotaxis protein [Agrobacterium larrymoorei]WHA42102.1 methyl-accepting chemotaxis protein [Agrobacterium larrymoorei]
MKLVDIPISKRLWAAVILPMLSAGYLSYAQISERLADYHNMNEVVVIGDQLKKLSGIAHALQVERGLTAGFIGSKGTKNIGELAAARKDTDGMVDGFPGISEVLLNVAGNSFSARQSSARKNLSDAVNIRASVDGLSATGGAAFAAYTAAVASIMSIADDLAAETANPDISRRIAAYAQLMHAKEIAGQERGLANGFIAAKHMDQARFADFASMAGGQQVLIDASLAAQDSERKRIADGLLNEVAKPVSEFRSKLLANGENADLSGLDSAAWFAAATKRIEALKQIENQTLDDISALAKKYAGSAFDNLVLMAAIIFLGAALMIAFSSVMAMTVVRPIRQMVGAMGRLAAGQIDSGEISSGRRDEIGDMEQAVEVFRQSAIRNRELEAAEAGNRERAERERAEMQRAAEEEAEARLAQATSTFAASMKRLAAGDMLCELHEPLSSQFEALRHDFNSSVHQLRETLASVGQSVSTVTGGSQEVSSASDDLSRRTEQQAASLEETAAALEQITANVASTSKRSAEARAVVRDAREKAGSSGNVVRNAVAAMGKIEDSSRQIGQIIGVIDEIAFQTNLLALNAGVEAARAGEAGKGFAVVAQEVRELAQRSAKAAKEIKQLIGNSEIAVSEGVRLVSDTGSGLNEIAELVQSVNAHMDAIATAAQEQSAGLAEVNTAVNHMDQATQQNAAMVEEMNAAGAALAQESAKLKGLLSHFQLGQASHQLRNTAETMRRAVVPEPATRPSSARATRAVPLAHGNAAVAISEDWTEF